MMLNIDNIPFGNKKTWKLLQSGHTCGCFQLESNLGQYWSGRIKPTNINELSAVVALLRPACLNSGQTEYFCKVKGGDIEKVSFNDPNIDNILEPTLGCLIYQEEIMQFGSEIAWKDLPKLERLVKVDTLRKSVSKKDSKTIQKLKTDFIEGFVRNGKTKKLAVEIFGIIEDAGRYAFCASHASKYAHYSYKTAYLKANFPLQFYMVYLSYSRFKIKPKLEIRYLINEARIFNIHVLPPVITQQNVEFRITNTEKKHIRYGLSHIKNVGSGDAEILHNEYLDNWTKLFLAHFRPTPRLRSLAIEALIISGACDSYGISRSILLQIFRSLKTLSPIELNFVIQKLPTSESVYELPTLLNECAEEVSVKRRKAIVKSEASELDLGKADTFTWKAYAEKEYLGIPLTCSAVDDKKTISKVLCKDCIKMIKENKGVEVSVNAVLDNLKKIVTKRGQNPGQEMAILEISDKTGQVRAACFPGQFYEYKNQLHEDLVYNLILKGTGSGWCIKKLFIL